MKYLTPDCIFSYKTNGVVSMQTTLKKWLVSAGKHINMKITPGILLERVALEVEPILTDLSLLGPAVWHGVL